jgi:hypothetical protein
LGLIANGDPPGSMAISACSALIACRASREQKWRWVLSALKGKLSI